MSHNNQHDHHNDDKNILPAHKKKPFGYEDTLIIYILYGLSFFTGILWIVTIIYAYVRRNDLKGTIYYSHLNYIIRTCWWYVGFSVVMFISIIIAIVIWFMSLTNTSSIFISIGFYALILSAIWLFIWSIYRGIKGFIYFKDGKPMV